MDSRVVSGAVSKGRLSLRKLGFRCLASDIALELVRAPASAHARTEAVLVNRRPQRMQHANMCKHLRPPEPPTAREQVLLVVKMKLRTPTSKEDSLRLQMSDGCLQTLRTVGAVGERRIRDRGFGLALATIPSSLLRVGSVRGQ